MISLPNIIKSLQYEKEFIRSSSFVNQVKSALAEVSEEQRNANAHRQSEDILSNAHKKAAEITEKAKEEAAAAVKTLEDSTRNLCAQMKIQSKQEGYEAGLNEGKREGIALGFQEGYEEGLTRAENEYRYMSERFEEMAQEFIKEKEKAVQSFSDDLEASVLTIAKAVIKREVEIHPEFLVQLAYDAIADCSANAWVKIYVSEKMMQMITENRPEITERLQGNVKLVANPEMSDTDCVCETPLKIIDAGIDTQFENIALNITGNQ